MNFCLQRGLHPIAHDKTALTLGAMKNLIRSSFAALVFTGALVTLSPVNAQSVETTQTTTTSDGTVSEFGADRFVVKSTTSAEPLRYSYGTTTTYVDETGAPVSVKTVASGSPVTVYYTKVGDTMMASKVVVRKVVTAAPAPVIEEKKTTTTTTTIEK